jgi:ribosomal protein S18 acetylase RimI-like enzyme
MHIRLLTAEETHPLRQLVLRPGRPLSACIWSGDDDPGAFHLGVEIGGQIVTIASVIPNRVPHQLTGLIDPQRPFQLRGMATHPDHRGLGYGRALLAACIDAVREAGGDVLWCNARTSAIEFYRQSGFMVAGEEYQTEVGPHFVMFAELTPAIR